MCSNDHNLNSVSGVFDALCVSCCARQVLSAGNDRGRQEMTLDSLRLIGGRKAPSKEDVLAEMERMGREKRVSASPRQNNL